VCCSVLQCEGGGIEGEESEDNEDEDGENKEKEESSSTGSPFAKKGRSTNLYDDKEVCTFDQRLHAAFVCACVCVIVWVYLHVFVHGVVRLTSAHVYVIQSRNKIRMIG